jgi:DNA replication protein DnaC
MQTSLLMEHFHTLRLSGMAAALEHQATQTAFLGLPFEQRLGFLVEAEINARDNKRLVRLLKVAKLKVHAASEELDYRPGRGIDRNVIAELLTCGWVARQQNILVTGPTGAGKTWIGCSLGLQAARKGHTVLYRRVNRLLEEMEIARTDGSIMRLRQQLARTQVLILDDFGLMPIEAAGRGDLLEVLDDRAGTGSTLVIGQLPIKEWHGFINDPALADAILDRLIHAGHKIALKGDSMRKVTGVKKAAAD